MYYTNYPYNSYNPYYEQQFISTPINTPVMDFNRPPGHFGSPGCIGKWTLVDLGGGNVFPMKVTNWPIGSGGQVTGEVPSGTFPTSFPVSSVVGSTCL
ncbi:MULTISPECIES: hypothetical protein [Bacillus cereus group]|uniref:Uncharacterized protein n=2 Tax=Bacillus cereus group TaxID=86661 RepID=A0A9X7CJX0_BACCE|nr:MULTISPECIES: hypothetical protein [Bacillus cereus group]PFJ30589.1 hypothetical protein COI92_06250 [Bacillus anthracis]MBG9749670.1 hypothetical protein [Bacillus thuringiensis]MBG9778197.1 hypothetical protein [Bacillus thuringiensis]OTX84945.1 hypothetical protein BK730_24555 [Bacillus wiedmannii]OTZ82512.1 hypothetical protein BK771_25450 [Bacillus thuringiensis serovar ostriniae]